MAKTHRYIVYILECVDKSFYIGAKNNVELRVQKHQTRLDTESYICTKRPVELVWYEEFKNIDQAIAFEKKLKGWSRSKKIALIKGDNQRLPCLSEKKFE